MIAGCTVYRDGMRREDGLPLAAAAAAGRAPGALVWIGLTDVHDHLLRVVAETEACSALLSDALAANLAQVQVRQNEHMRTISAAAAIAAVPTVVGAVYGMDFRHMPELDWTVGHPLVMVLTAVACAYLYARFKRGGWL